MSAVPKHVQLQAEQVEQIEQAIASSMVQAEVLPDPVVDAEAQTNPDPQPTVVEPAPVPPPPPAVDWEQKYKTLQGIFNSQVPQLQQKLQQMEDELASVKKQQAPAEATTQPAADPKDVEVFGADLVDMVNRVASVAATTASKTLESRLSQLEQQLATTGQAVTQVSQDRFMTELERRVPDWATINKDDRFLGWLAELDPLYGVPRQSALDAAVQAQNATQAAKVFETWKQLTAAPVPPPRPSLQSQVAPRVSASAPVPASQAKPIVTQKFIQDFYNKMAQGKFRGREAEAKAIEAEIDLALVEGRVR